MAFHRPVVLDNIRSLFDNTLYNWTLITFPSRLENDVLIVARPLPPCPPFYGYPCTYHGLQMTIFFLKEIPVQFQFTNRVMLVRRKSIIIHVPQKK
jgi:hypothetical protein